MNSVKAAPLNPEQYALVTFCEQMYLMTGQLPDEATCKQAGYDSATFKHCLKLPVFNLALSQRGIRPYNELDSSGNVSQALSPEQLLVANTILNQSDNRSRKKKLADLHVSADKFETWLRDPAFQRYLSVRGEALLGDHGFDAHLALVERVQAGDVSAIKYFNEITGRFIPAKDKGLDVQSILLRVMEVIQRRIVDGNIQMLIADDLIEIAKESSGQFNGVPLVGRLRPEGQVIEVEVSRPDYKPAPLSMLESNTTASIDLDL